MSSEEASGYSPLSNNTSAATGLKEQKPVDNSDNDRIPKVPRHLFVVEGCPAVDKPKPSNNLTKCHSGCHQGNYVDDRHPPTRPQSSSKSRSFIPEIGSTSSLFPSCSSLLIEADVPNVSSSHRVLQSKSFSIVVLKQCLEACIRNGNGEIDLGGYLDAYREICKLLDTLGNVIQRYIGRDIKQKISILKRFQQGENGPFYKTIDRMVTFEKVKRIPQKNQLENGSRTVLILHRSFQFIIEFLRNLNKLRSEDYVGSMGREVYNSTLGPHHPWQYRNVARIALSLLGQKRQLIYNFHDGSLTPAQLEEVIESVVNVASQVYTSCQAIYERNNFLHLP